MPERTISVNIVVVVTFQVNISLSCCCYCFFRFIFSAINGLQCVSTHNFKVMVVIIAQTSKSGLAEAAATT